MKNILLLFALFTLLNSCKKEDVCRNCEISVSESFSVTLTEGYSEPVVVGYNQSTNSKQLEVCTDEHWDRLMEQKDKFTLQCD